MKRASKPVQSNKDRNRKRGASVNPDLIYKRRKKIPPYIDFERAFNDAKAIDKKTKWSYALLAKRAGLKNRNNIVKWFDKKRNSNITFRTIKLIFAILNLPINEYLVESKYMDRVTEKNKKEIRDYNANLKRIKYQEKE